MLKEGNLHNSYIFVKFTLFLTCGVDGNRGLGLRLAVPTDDNEARLPSLPGWTKFDCSEKSSGILSEDTAFSFQTYSSVSWTCCVLGTRVGRPPHLEKNFHPMKSIFSPEKKYSFNLGKAFFTRGVASYALYEVVRGHKKRHLPPLLCFSCAPSWYIGNALRDDGKEDNNYFENQFCFTMNIWFAKIVCKHTAPCLINVII